LIAILFNQKINTYILFDADNFGNTTVDGGSVEVGHVRIPLVWGGIAREKNDFRLKPDKASFNSSSKRVAIREFFEDIERRHSICSLQINSLKRKFFTV